MKVNVSMPVQIRQPYIPLNLNQLTTNNQRKGVNSLDDFPFRQGTVNLMHENIKKAYAKV